MYNPIKKCNNIDNEKSKPSDDELINESNDKLQ